MKKVLFITLLLNTLIFANMNVVASILPEKTFIKAIGGERVDISVMVLPGNSPHTYEPKPSQMRDISRARLYFAIGVEFEKVWLQKFRRFNPQMHVIDLTQGIEKRVMHSPHAHGHSHHDEAEGDQGKDPHIWTAPENVKMIARHIYRALCDADPSNAVYYEKNYKAFLQKIEETDWQIRQRLAALPKGTKFMVFHPSWGYFADAYGLIQLPVEVAGKEPKPRELIALIKEARAEKVKAVFTQPEFSDTTAQVMAKELQISVIKVSPLSADWSETLLKIADAIAGSVQTER
jgi:zinc transport system substrate-binding protein